MINKKIVFIVSIFIVIIIGVSVYLKLESNKNTKDTYIIKEKIESVQEKIDKPNEDALNTIVEENLIENNTNTDIIVNEEEKKSSEDKAIELAEKEWGKDDTVYFKIQEKKSEKEYIVSVRNKETTAILMNYEINTDTGIVEEY